MSHQRKGTLNYPVSLYLPCVCLLFSQMGRSRFTSAPWWLSVQLEKRVVWPLRFTSVLLTYTQQKSAALSNNAQILMDTYTVHILVSHWY